MFTKTTPFFGLALLALLAGCSKSYVDPSVASINKADSTILAYIKTKGLALKQNSSGLYYAIKPSALSPAGKTPSIGDELAFTYKVLTLKDSILDQSHKDTLSYIPLGAAGINPGLQEILSTMHVGDTASLLTYNQEPVVSANNVVLLKAYVPYRQDIALVASRTEDEQINEYVATKAYTITEKTTSGVRVIKTVTNPTGATLTTGQTVTVKYSGYTIHATKPFDPGTTPFLLTLGRSQAIPGFEEGVTKLKVGEKATIIIPSAQGYGSVGRQQQLSNGQSAYVIQPYAPLIFYIEIVSAQ